MRVISGEFKGRVLKMPKGVKIRPTSQKVKEALFSILGSQICEASFLDLFAGSGSVGIEAISRGAERVFFVENNRLCIKTIEQNLNALGLECSPATLLPFTAERAIGALARKKQRFDFVFLDPPYYEEKLKNCLIKISAYDILNPRSWVIAEHNQAQVLPQQLSGLRVMFTKTYGDTALSFYRARPKK